jgi:hypothetical protein
MDDRFKILDVFAERGNLSPTTARMARSYALKWEVSGFDALLDLNIFSESSIANLIGEAFGTDRVFNFMHCPHDPRSLRLIPFNVARGALCYALGATESADFEVVFADPTRKTVTDQVRKALGRDFVLAVSERNDILKAIFERYPLQDQLDGALVD